MSTLRESAQQALEALEEYAPQHGNPDDMDAAITALRAALVQEEQEPVARRDPVTDDIVSVAHRAAWETDYGLGGKGRAATYTEPLYTHPPRREWVSLPACEDKPHAVLVDGYGYVDVRAVRAIEAKLKERNNG